MAKKTDTTIDIFEVKRGTVTFNILGTTPILLNRMSNKGVREILFPKGKKTSADKQNSLKHDPYAEFVSSPYMNPDPAGPTLITHLAVAFKKAIAAAAMDVPGSSKAQIGRLAWVTGERLPIYGIPQMHMGIVRSSDMNHTPDVRTRCIIPHWATQVTVEFPEPQLNEKAIMNLLIAGGMMQGIADYRPGKGAGNHGSFTVVNSDNEEFNHIIETGGRKAQCIAMDSPEPYDTETEELYSWFVAEVEERGKSNMLAKRTPFTEGGVIRDDGPNSKVKLKTGRSNRELITQGAQD